MIRDNTIKNWAIGIGWIILELILLIIIAGLIIVGLEVLIFYVSDYNVNILEDTSYIATHPWQILLVQYIPLSIGLFIGIIIVNKSIFHRPLKMAGLHWKYAWEDFTIGYLWAFVMLLIGFLVLIFSNQMMIEKLSWNPLLFLGFLCLFLIQSLFEELLTRSFMISSMAIRTNIPFALIVSSFLFCVLHWGNPNMNIWSYANLFLAGLLMGLLFLKTKSIWGPLGLHAGWNFLQGSFFGFEVSGLEVYSLIDSQEVGPDWLTGGAFGFEGSFISVILLLVSCYLLVRDGRIWRMRRL